jgi:hypothetical protein
MAVYVGSDYDTTTLLVHADEPSAEYKYYKLIRRRIGKYFAVCNNALAAFTTCRKLYPEIKAVQPWRKARSTYCVPLPRV